MGIKMVIHHIRCVVCENFHYSFSLSLALDL